jgi:hypothetical protein
MVVVRSAIPQPKEKMPEMLDHHNLPQQPVRPLFSGEVAQGGRSHAYAARTAVHVRGLHELIAWVSLSGFALALVAEPNVDLARVTASRDQDNS